MKRAKIGIAIAAAVTLAAVVTWQMTGGDYYTKFEVVEQVQSPVDENDPLVAAGFYEGDSVLQTVTRDEFRFGLLPAPSGIFDKHGMSVASVSGPFWVAAIGLAWWSRRKEKTRR